MYNISLVFDVRAVHYIRLRTRALLIYKNCYPPESESIPSVPLRLTDVSVEISKISQNYTSEK